MSNLEFVDGSAHSVQLQQAILLYGKRSDNTEYATFHPVRVGEDGNGQPVIGAGVPLTKNTLLTIAKNLARSTRRAQGVLPPNVLAVGVDHIVWYVPAQPRTMFFDCRGDEGVGKRAGKTPQPALIFAVSQQDWRIYAIKAKGRPKATAPLYNAPYMNVWQEGRICVGSTPVPNDTIAETIDQWTTAFFDSNFSHTNHDKTVRYKGGCHAFWNDALDGKFPRFPNEVLVRSKGIKTLGALVEALETGGSW